MRILIVLGLASQAAGLTVVPDHEFEFIEAGSCASAERTISMQDVLLLRNEQVRTNAGGGSLTLALLGEDVRVVREGRDDAAIREIDKLISPDADIDIELSFALLEGETVVHWRETYRHRMYRQGLLRVGEDRIIPLCEGMGGVNRSH